MAILTRLKGIRARKGRGKLWLFNKRPVTLDSHEMPLGYQKMMVIDEYGGLGELPEKHENTFGFAVSVVERPDAYGSLTEYNRVFSPGIEIKASSDPRRYYVTRDISLLEPEVYGFYIDKHDPPNGWIGSKAREKMIGTLDSAIGSVLRDVQGNVYVVVDFHTAYRESAAPMIRSHSDGSRIVDGDVYDSDRYDFKGVLQTTDYVASALRGYAEFHDSTRTDQLGMRIHRIGRDDSIKKRI